MNPSQKKIAAAALRDARNAKGGCVALANALGVTSQAISQWKRVPAERCRDVEIATGVPRYLLRPDIFDAPAASLAA